MTASAVLNDLVARAERIARVVAEGRMTLEGNEATQWKSLALARFQMLRALEEFITFKEERILVPIICGSDPATAKAASLIRDENYELQKEYDAFIMRWTLTNRFSIDHEYRNEAYLMSRRIEDQVDHDIRRLTALLTEVGWNSGGTSIV